MTFIKNGDTFEEESKFHKIHFTQKSKKTFFTSRLRLLLSPNN